MSEYKPLSTFQPVPARPRHDGWTPERQIAFIEKLADCGSAGICKRLRWAVALARSRSRAR